MVRISIKNNNGIGTYASERTNHRINLRMIPDAFFVFERGFGERDSA
jgi:hypothetical protein